MKKKSSDVNIKSQNDDAVLYLHEGEMGTA
jgi:hypothetical protein